MRDSYPGYGIGEELCEPRRFWHVTVYQAGKLILIWPPVPLPALTNQGCQNVVAQLRYRVLISQYEEPCQGEMK